MFEFALNLYANLFAFVTNSPWILMPVLAATVMLAFQSEQVN